MIIDLAIASLSFVFGYFVHRRVNIRYRKRWRDAVSLLKGETEDGQWKLESRDDGSTIFFYARRGGKKIKLDSVGHVRARTRHPNRSLQEALRIAIVNGNKTIEHMNESGVE